MEFPAYNDLPLITVNNQRKRCVWGIFDKDGKKDVYGCLNKVTPDVVAKAAAEVKDGVTISLNGNTQSILYCVRLTGHVCVLQVEFNTQCSSQWDSLYWHARGGLATRGVLVDYKAYADRKGIQYSPFSAHKITIAIVEDIVREQGVEFRRGDLFLLRTGYTEEIQAAKGEEEQIEMLNAPDSVGIEDTMQAVEWFWNQHFSAVAADNVGFEVMRPTKNGVAASGTTADYVLHPNFLSLLGLHIGELWDLKALSEYCHKTGRFTFMLTSMPLNFAGACGSPPNAMALF
ncbi:Uncharacterized protein TPAR_07276 [Tolypocladium paradoxum]|uniref:Cyclase n=1 Tax=Tolypocladium paradoxum TaxID=94208 RepID=A0A2S4KQM3_9HYPO|nr:Uncharacterized protein TPAR_07276 [Tolypocladium paradoxum]